MGMGPWEEPSGDPVTFTEGDAGRQVSGHDAPCSNLTGARVSQAHQSELGKIPTGLSTENLKGRWGGHRVMG